MGAFLTIDLPKPVKVTALGGEEIDITKIEIYEVIDSPFRKSITAICRNHPTKIQLWKDADYDTIAQWTDTDVINRVLELYSN